MDFKGMDRLREHFPELNSRAGRAILALTALGVFASTTIYFVATDHIPNWSLASQIIAIAIAYLWISLFFSRKKQYQQKYGELAYRTAFSHFALPGLAIMLAAVAHMAYIKGPELPPSTIKTALKLIGVYWIVVGALLWIRAVLTFGADNLAMLYVYFPDEGRIIDSNIYSILRHPVYAGVLRLGIGLALLNSNANSLAFAVLMPLGVTSWLRLVEEKELLKRISSYAEYRKRVPVFWLRLQDFGKFWRFILTGK